MHRTARTQLARVPLASLATRHPVSLVSTTPYVTAASTSPLLPAVDICNTLVRYLTVKRGFFPSPNFTNVISIGECRSGGLGDTSCNPFETATFQCDVGYEGRLCSQCSAGYFVENNKCARCWAPAVILTLFVAGIASGLAYFLWLSLKKFEDRNANGFIIMSRSILFYVQMTSVLLINAPFRWPKKVLALAIPYGWLQFKFGLLTCLQSASEASTNTSNTFLFLGPILLAGFGVFCCAVLAIYLFASHFIASKSYSDALATTKEKVLAYLPGFGYSLVWGINVLYTPITIAVLSKFVCAKDETDGQFYEYHNPWQICSVYDSNVSIPSYICAIIFYVMGIPLLYVAVALRYASCPSVNVLM
jgi:hypothetical protein